MIHKTGLRLYVAFYTSAEAMAMERACRSAGIPGRLKPVPRSITSDCGIAWATGLDQRQALEELIVREGLETAGLYEREG